MAQNPKPYLPGVLALIAEEVSEAAAVKLAQERGGRMVWIPKNPKPDGTLAKMVGIDAATKISALLGQGDLKVPSGSLGGATGRRYRIEEMFNRGLSNSAIAEAVDVDLRTVERTVAKLRNAQQPGLPF